jgi:hypothetical protein
VLSVFLQTSDDLFDVLPPWKDIRPKANPKETKPKSRITTFQGCSSVNDALDIHQKNFEASLDLLLRVVRQHDESALPDNSFGDDGDSRSGESDLHAVYRSFTTVGNELEMIMER